MRRLCKLVKILGGLLGLSVVTIGLLALWLWPRDPYMAAVEPDFSLYRIASNPIITTEMSPRLAQLAAQQGFANLNGPSVIRVPDWVTDPLGRYYMYFAHHKGDFIRMAYADAPTGPWTVFEPGVLALADSGFPVDKVPIISVFKAVQELWNNFSVYIVRDALRVIIRSLVIDQAERERRGIPPTRYKTPHIASPDVVIDGDNQRLVMFYHGQKDTLGQVTHTAVSKDGLNFSLSGAPIQATYVRSFQYQGQYYLLGTLGMLLRSEDMLGKYLPRDKPLFDPALRHLSVALDDSQRQLHIFWSRVGDAPEHLLYSRVVLSPNWNDWRATAGVPVLWPEQAWEGGDLAVQSSLRGELVQATKDLRDPNFFIDKDERSYVYYVASGEQVIGVAELIPK